MSMMRIQPAPFFASKNRAFWNLQLAGWGGYFLLRSLVAIANNQSLDLVAVIMVQTITGFSITLVLSVVFRQLIGRQAFVTWGMTALVLAGAVFLQTSIDAWVQGVYLGSANEATFVQRLVGLSILPLALLGGWSALYYAINYFLTVEQQADRLERLEAQATAAQLAMLRYQLNPHFLFNTLNSISTLVLLKQTDQANAMLTRLSGFLRHTLITEPGSQVTLAQEVETLQLYLDIERMRFEERLRTRFEIDDAALAASLPSMLLQPLVENAVKYAVSPQEEGAEITLTARVVGQRLRIAIEDTGPGMEGPVQLSMLDHLPQGEASEVLGSQPISTGVGLANIRNRLTQTYGDAHLFETRSQPGGGFAVLIEIPYQPAADIAQQSELNAPEAAADSVSSPRPQIAAPDAPETAGNVISLNPARNASRTPPRNPNDAIGNT
ncbi:MAG: sensor histidine kinase [Pseudomonadota bacterium]